LSFVSLFADSVVSVCESSLRLRNTGYSSRFLISAVKGRFFEALRAAVDDERAANELSSFGAVAND